MNDHPAPALLKISTVNVSVDGARIAPDEGKVNIPVTEAAALAALQAFAALPTMDLVHADAKIYLAGPHGKLAVQNERGRLFATSVPESMNTSAQRTPEEIIAELLAHHRAAAAPAEAADAKMLADLARQTGGWRDKLGSGWGVAALAVVTALVAYVTFAPETPEGVEIIRDPAKISRLHSDFNGHYGSPSATILTLENGHLTGREPTGTGGAGVPLFDKDYQFGLSDGRVVLVADNGAVLEPQPDGSLKFLESTYPRLKRP